ncbi:MAG: hypothetical protein J0I12_30645 [Candidatus Eremiobacteraeota bacterium]|nr:hypothetical protein [Candidatus Eremiobacteraeota bacterium]
MFLSSKKFRKLRRRAWLAGVAAMASGCVYWGSSLAWAHSRPPLTLLPQHMPEVVQRVAPGQESWIPSLLGAPVDLLANPELHAQEENCNVAGFYADSTPEFELKGPGWSYSSLEGMLAQASAPVQEDPKKFGYRGDAPVWMLVEAKRLAASLPAGIHLSPRVRAVESRMWPAQQRGEVMIHFTQALNLPTSKKMLSLEQVWKHLPSAPVMGCLRKEVADAVLANHGRLTNGAEHWVGAALPVELRESQWNSLWNSIQSGWTPSALWVDFACSGVASGRDVALSHDDQGTLFAVGMEAMAGSSTVPGDGVGAGRFQWESHRVEWTASVSEGQLLIAYHWSESPIEADTAEVATMKPDLETLYTIRPNVLAGR